MDDIREAYCPLTVLKSNMTESLKLSPHFVFVFLPRRGNKLVFSVVLR